MGLDILDIQFRVEKAFGVELTHDDFFEVMRDRDILVGDLYNLLLKKLLLHDVARYDIRLTYLKVLWMCRPLRNCFPARMATVKDLCRTVLATNYEEMWGASEIPFDDRCIEVWRQLTGILVDALGVEADAITFRSRLFQDLGAA